MQDGELLRTWAGPSRHPAKMVAGRFESREARRNHVADETLNAARALHGLLSSRAAWRAARDEVRHTLAMVRLAARSGARVTRRVIASRPVRSLEAMATENAVEGCVPETYGAATAMLQALKRDLWS